MRKPKVNILGHRLIKRSAWFVCFKDGRRPKGFRSGRKALNYALLHIDSVRGLKRSEARYDHMLITHYRINKKGVKYKSIID